MQLQVVQQYVHHVMLENFFMAETLIQMKRKPQVPFREQRLLYIRCHQGRYGTKLNRGRRM